MRKLFLLLLLVFMSCTQIKVANESYEQGSYKDTLATCKSILESDSTNADVHYLMGQAYSNLDHVDSALTSYKTAVHYQPENTKFKEKYYLTTIELGEQFLPDDTKTALEYFDKAILIDTTQFLAFEKRSDLQFELGKYELALAGYQKVLTRGGDTLRIENKIAKIDRSTNSAEEP